MTHVRLKWPSLSTPAVLCHARMWMWQWILKIWELQPVDWLPLVTWLWTPFLLETMIIGNKHHSLGRLRPVGYMEDQLRPVVMCSHSVMPKSLRPHGLQHARFPCPSLSPIACSNSCPSSWWCHPTISSSVIPFSFCLQFFLASGSFPVTQLFASGGQSIGASASASVLTVNIQVWFPFKSLLRRTHLYLSTCIWNVVATVICHRFNVKLVKSLPRHRNKCFLGRPTSELAGIWCAPIMAVSGTVTEVYSGSLRRQSLLELTL